MIRDGSFPRYGKTFRKFSTLWKIIFHSVENFHYRLFPGFQAARLRLFSCPHKAPLRHKRLNLASAEMRSFFMKGRRNRAARSRTS